MSIKEVINNTNSSHTIRHLKKNGLYEEFIRSTSFLDDHYESISDRQRLWHFKNDHMSLVTCPMCNSLLPFKEKYSKYSKGCSEKCRKQLISRSSKESHEQGVQEKIRSTTLKRYGVDNYAKSKEHKEKKKQMNKELFGKEHWFQTEEFRNKYRSTMREKYGVDHYFQTEEHKKNVLKKSKKWFKEEFIKRLPEAYELVEFEFHKEAKVLHRECGKEFSMDGKLVSDRISAGITLCSHCNPTSFGEESDLEKKFAQEISHLYGGKMIRNTHEVIPPYQLDIYLPDVSLAIEINGLYWHCSLNKPRNYHKAKTDRCKELGIHLLHIFEDDLKYKKKIIMDLLKNKIHGPERRVYARSCSLRSVEHYQIFLEDNHVQGSTNLSKVKGLYYEGELLQIMGFKKREDGLLELARCCSKRSVSVVGGASKLFKALTNETKVQVVVSYCDRSMFTGKVHDHLGILLDGTTAPSKQVVIGGRRYHRRTARKKEGRKLDIYDSGLDRYFWIRKREDVDPYELAKGREEECYLVVEAYWHLRGRYEGFTPMRVDHEGRSHWFLKKDEEVLDPTVGQFTTEPSYEKGRPVQFRSISKRTLEIIRSLEDK